MKSKQLITYTLGALLAITSSCKMSPIRYDYSSEFGKGKNSTFNERNDSTEQMREFRLHSKEILKAIYERYNVKDMEFSAEDSVAVNDMIKQQEEMFGIHSDYSIRSSHSKSETKLATTKGMISTSSESNTIGAVVNSIDIIENTKGTGSDTLKAHSTYFSTFW